MPLSIDCLLGKSSFFFLGVLAKHHHQLAIISKSVILFLVNQNACDTHPAVRVISLLKNDEKWVKATKLTPTTCLDQVSIFMCTARRGRSNVCQRISFIRRWSVGHIRREVQIRC